MNPTAIHRQWLALGCSVSTRIDVDTGQVIMQVHDRKSVRRSDVKAQDFDQALEASRPDLVRYAAGRKVDAPENTGRFHTRM